MKEKKMENIIELKNVSKKFKKETILSNCSVSFEKGKTHGIVGENGSGKTVLLKLICGLLYPDDGAVFVSGKQIGKDVDFPDDVGVIIETPGFLPHQSGFNNLNYLASLRHRIDSEGVEKAITFVGLDPKDKKHVGKYSLGMKQRLGIAQAIMENPSILILDEPMNGLDRSGVESIRQLLQNLKSEGRTILLASHLQDDIDLLCDTVHLVDNGTLVRAR